MSTKKTPTTLGLAASPITAVSAPGKQQSPRRKRPSSAQRSAVKPPDLELIDSEKSRHDWKKKKRYYH